MRAIILKGVTYNTIAAVSAQAISFGRSIILARLLAPHDFGLFGMATLALSATETLLNLQLTVSLIPQKLGDEEHQKRWLNTVWSLELVRSFLVFLLVAAAATPVAKYFGEPQLIRILLVTSLGTLLSGLLNVGMALHQKAMNFRPVVLWEMLSAFFNFGVTVALAYVLRNAYALAWGAVFAALVRIALSYFFHPYRPSWEIDRTVLRESLRFGVNLLIVGVLTYLTTQFDNIVVGKYFGTTVLGFYLVAYTLAMVPVQFVGGVVSKTLFPTFSKVLHENPDRAFSLWVLSLKYTGWLVLVFSVPLWVERDRLIPWLYGQKWEPAVAPFGILIFAGLLRGFVYVSSSMINALGKPEVDAKAKAAETVLFIGLVLTLVKPLGMVGAAWAGVACYAIAFLTRTLYVGSRQKGLLTRVIPLMPRLVAGFVICSFLGWLVRQLGAPVFVNLLLDALLVMACALALEAEMTRSLSGVWDEFFGNKGITNAR